ncbi:MAG: hypothetical protein ACRC6V_05065 [Bacteroidales bacterium]
MSLSADFQLYYRQTYVGYRTNSGRTLPFYIQDVTGGGSHNDSGLNRLVFHGQVMYDDRQTEREVRYNSEKLVLELPELGYVHYRGRNIWLTYRPVHQASKGLSGRRLVGTQMNNDVARAIYRAVNDQPNDLARQFSFDANGNLYYKRREVGTHSEGTATLKSDVPYLRAYLMKAYPNITEVEVSENVDL